jgi:hypothetical protein
MDFFIYDICLCIAICEGVSPVGTLEPSLSTASSIISLKAGPRL